MFNAMSLVRNPCARLHAGPRVSSPRLAVRPATVRCPPARCTSQSGRMGEGGQEETPLRDTIKKTSTEQQYGSTTPPPPAEVDEEHQPGFYHETREELERSGAVVHEELRPRTGTGGGFTTRSRPGQGAPDDEATAPESGTEGRGVHGGGTGSSGGAAGGTATFTRKPDDEASAPESGTR